MTIMCRLTKFNYVIGMSIVWTQSSVTQHAIRPHHLEEIVVGLLKLVQRNAILQLVSNTNYCLLK
jgi:hypothetical protein